MKNIVTSNKIMQITFYEPPVRPPSPPTGPPIQPQIDVPDRPAPPPPAPKEPDPDKRLS